MKKAPHKDGAGKEFQNALNKLNSTPSRHNCKNCGTPTCNPLCASCYRWRIHFNTVQQAMRAMRAIREDV